MFTGSPGARNRLLSKTIFPLPSGDVSWFGTALIHDALGEKEPALAALERAHEDHAVEFSQMDQYPPFKTIASEHRYQAIMQQIGLPH